MKDSEDAPAPNQFLETIHQLFGISWDRAFQWVVAGYASAWFWICAIPWPASPQRTSRWTGPVSWLIQMLQSLSIAVPGWVWDMPEWLSSPERAWIEQVLVVVAAVCVTCLAQNPGSSGLAIVGVLSLLLAFQVAEDLKPGGSVILVSLAPLIGALGVALYRYRRGDDADFYLEFRSDFIFTRYLIAGLSIFWQPVAAPVSAFVLLVRAYGIDFSDNNARKLTSHSLYNLRRSRKSLAEANAAEVLGVIAGVLLASHSPSERRELASAIQFDLHDSALGAIHPNEYDD